jgi:hypothetical protein
MLTKQIVKKKKKSNQQFKRRKFTHESIHHFERLSHGVV